MPGPCTDGFGPTRNLIQPAPVAAGPALFFRYAAYGKLCGQRDDFPSAVTSSLVAPCAIRLGSEFLIFRARWRAGGWLGWLSNRLRLCWRRPGGWRRLLRLRRRLHWRCWRHARFGGRWTGKRCRGTRRLGYRWPGHGSGRPWLGLRRRGSRLGPGCSGGPHRRRRGGNRRRCLRRRQRGRSRRGRLARCGWWWTRHRDWDPRRSL